MRIRKLKRHVIIWILLLVLLIIITAFVIGLGIAVRFEMVNSAMLLTESIEISCLFISIVLSLTGILSEAESTKALRWIQLLVFINFMMLSLDAITWIVDGKPQWTGLNFWANTVLYFLPSTLIFVLYIYIIDVLNNWGKRRIRVLTGVLGALVALTVISTIGNYWGHYYFIVDETGHYHRAGYYIISMGAVYIIDLILIVMIIISREKLGSTGTKIYLAYVVVPILVNIVTLPVYGLNLSSAAAMIVFLLMYCVFNVEEAINGAKTRRELAIATEIQLSALPDVSSQAGETDRFGLYADMVAAKSVGGDFYDFFRVDEDHFAILMADVSGKGIPAALFMMIAKTLIKNRTMMGGDPAEILTDVGNQISENNEAQLFVTVWLGIIDLSNGHVLFCNAGHDYPGLYRAEDGVYTWFKTKNSPALALFPGIPFMGGELDLSDGDRIFLYTDGLPEAVNREDEQYGMDRALESLNRRCGLNDRDLINGIYEDVFDFIGEEPQFDDLTMLSFTYRRSQG